jgi:hypothetical protein
MTFNGNKHLPDNNNQNGNVTENPLTCVATPAITCYHTNRRENCVNGNINFCCPHCQAWLAETNSSGELAAKIKCWKCKNKVEV